MATPALDPYSSSQASDIAQPVNQNQFDVILSLMQNVNEKLLGMTNEYQKLRDHVNNLEKEVKSPIYDRETIITFQILYLDLFTHPKHLGRIKFIQTHCIS